MNSSFLISLAGPILAGIFGVLGVIRATTVSKEYSAMRDEYSQLKERLAVLERQDVHHINFQTTITQRFDSLSRDVHEMSTLIGNIAGKVDLLLERTK